MNEERLPTGGKFPVHHTSSRWLKWDGFPDLSGACNSVRGPIDPSKGPLDSALILRLKHLGFECGDGTDAKKKESVWMALKEILGYVNLPPQDNVNFEKNARPADLGADVATLLQAHGKAALEAMDDPMDSANYKSWGYSTEKYFQVRIKSVPANFRPMAESAGIEIEMIGFTEIKSMLLRIFPGNGVRPVYQELFDEAAVASLPKLKPKTGNVIRHHDHKSFLMLQKRSELGGRFKRLQTQGVYDRALGPYKVEVWISSQADAFERNANGMIYPKADAAMISDALWTGEDAEAKNLIGKPCTHHDRAFLEDNQLVLFDPYVVELEKNALKTYADLWARAKKHKADHCANKSTTGVCAAASKCQQPNACQAGFWPIGELQGTFDNILRHANRLEQQFCCGECGDPEPGPILDLKGQVPVVLGAVRIRVKQLADAGYPYRPCLEFIGKWIVVVEHIIQVTRVAPEQEHYSRVYGKPVKGNEANLLIWGRNNAEVWRAKAGKNLSPGMPPLQATLMESYTLGLKGPGPDDHHLPEILKWQEAIAIPSYNPLDTVFFRKTRQVPLFVLALIDFKYLIADRTYMTPQTFFNHDCFHVVGVYPYVADGVGQKASAQLLDTMLDDFQATKVPARPPTQAPLTLEKAYDYWNLCARLLDARVGMLDAEVNKLAKETDNLRKSADPGLAQSRATLDAMTAFRDAVNILFFTLLHEPIAGDLIQKTHRAFRSCVTLDKNAMLARLNIKDWKDKPDGFLTAIQDRFTTGFFGRLGEEEYYKPSQLAAIQAGIDCADCKTGKCNGITPAMPNHPPLARVGTPCVRGWVVNNLAVLPDFDTWIKQN